MQANLAVNDFRREAEMDFNAVPRRLAAADFQNHHAVTRAGGILGHGLAGQLVRRAEAVSGGPAIERYPRCHRRRCCRRLRTRNHDGRSDRLNGRRNRLDRLRRKQICCGGIGPIQRRRNQRPGLADDFRRRPRLRGAARQKYQRATKKDSRRFEHPPIVRNRKRDSSCFRIFD